MVGKRLTGVARRLRKEPTDAEARLWWHLRGRQLGVHFTRQFQIGDSVTDFACRRLKLAIELDGGQHADNAEDEERTRLIEAHGYAWSGSGTMTCCKTPMVYCRRSWKKSPSPGMSGNSPSPLRGRVGVGVFGG